jgi:hypothetical protein
MAKRRVTGIDFAVHGVDKIVDVCVNRVLGLRGNRGLPVKIRGEGGRRYEINSNVSEL